MKTLSLVVGVILVFGCRGFGQDEISKGNPCDQKNSTLLSKQVLCGAGSRGGGDTQSDNPASSTQVIEQISYVKQPLRYALNFMEGNKYIWSVNGKDLTPLLNRFLHGPRGKTYLDILNQIRFVPKVKGPCIDSMQNNTPHDASAFNADPKEICMSIEHITGKATYSNSLQKIVGLAAHEIVHRILGYAPEIEEVANMVQSSVETGYLGNSQNYKYFNEELQNQLKHSFDYSAVMNKYKGHTDLTCGLAISAGDGTRGIRDIDLSFYEHYQQIIQHSLYLQTIQTADLLESTLGGYCLEENMEEKQSQVKAFNGQSEITTQQFATLVWKSTSPEDYYNESILFVKYHDENALLLEMARVEERILKFKSYIDEEKVLSDREALEAKSINEAAQKDFLVAETTRLQAEHEKPHVEWLKSLDEKAADLLNNSIVRENSFKYFDAKGFAMALKLKLNADKVIVESAKQISISNFSKWNFSDLTTQIYDSRSGGFVEVQVSIIKNGVRHTGKGKVSLNYVGTQQAATLNLSTHDHDAFTWWDENGEVYDPHYGAWTKLYSTSIRLNYKALVR